MNYCRIISIVLFAAWIWVYLQASDRPADPSLVLENEDYDLVGIDAPSAQGALLRILAFFFSNRLTGGVIKRFIMQHDNNSHRLCDLAAKVPNTIPSVNFPILRLKPNEESQHASWAQNKADVADKRKTKKFINSLDLVKAYKSGTISPVDVVKNSLKAAKKVNDLYKVFVLFEKEDKLLKWAKESEQRWKTGTELSQMDGVPVATKDEIDLEGYPTSFGTHWPNGKPAAKKSDIILRRLKAAGAIIIGKTTMTEYGMSPIGFNPKIAGPFNAYNRGYNSGGSSAGSAIAVALGIVPVAIGLDGGGSIRIPASKNGVVGLFPTFGRVPSDTGVSGYSSVTHHGPLCATVADCAIAHMIIADKDPNHYFTEMYGGNGPPEAHIFDFGNSDISKLKIGFFETYFHDGTKEHIEVCDNVVSFLKKKGASFVDFKQGQLSFLQKAHSFSIAAEMSLEHRLDYWGMGATLEPNSILVTSLGMSVNSIEWLSSQRLRGWAMRKFKEHFSKFDVFVLPTIGRKPVPISEGHFSAGLSDTSSAVDVMKFIFLANLLGFPCITVPVGYDSEDLPIGFQICGPHWREDLILRLANVIETEFTQRKTPKDWQKIM